MKRDRFASLLYWQRDAADPVFVLAAVLIAATGP